MGWALIRGWALINFFCLWDGRLFEVGANSRLGAYSNKYGKYLLLAEFSVRTVNYGPSIFHRWAINRWKKRGI